MRGSRELAARNHLRTNSDTPGDSWIVGRPETANNSSIINHRKYLTDPAAMQQDLRQTGTNWACCDAVSNILFRAKISDGAVEDEIGDVGPSAPPFQHRHSQSDNLHHNSRPLSRMFGDKTKVCAAAK